MKRILCPQCGEVKYYQRVENEQYVRDYDANGKERETPADPKILYWGAKRCIYCGKKIKIVDD